MPVIALTHVLGRPAIARTAVSCAVSVHAFAFTFAFVAFFGGS